MNRGAIFVKDEPGLVAARTISLIVNEAFFALEKGVSTIEENKLAMKPRANYPYDPFQWLQKRRLQNIYGLLQKLSVKVKR